MLFFERVLIQSQNQEAISAVAMPARRCLGLLLGLISVTRSQMTVNDYSATSYIETIWMGLVKSH